ncbi:hypothetical protein [Roseateles chitosanitabidus]|nr:hypothetical protein [Roseateles chitosanitabidus]MBO9687461.1 hypothetical protein [Roseateles chitosanitabidus]
MKQIVMKAVLAASLGVLPFLAPAPALAGDWPMTLGDYWEVTGVHLKDGGALTYAQFLAKDWKADQEFAKSKGWIKSYMILSNNNPRKGEPDLYLVVSFDRMAAGAEMEKRNDDYLAWRKKSEAQLQKESGNRFEFREIGSSMLLQELKIK